MTSPVPSSSGTAVFVYGTLMPGRLRWPVVADRVTGQRPATVTGTLLDTGFGYPALVLDGDGPVHGWVLDLDPARAGATLDLLDRIEGPGYDRVAVVAADGRPGGTPALTYVARGDTGAFRAIASGRWPATDER